MVFPPPPPPTATSPRLSRMVVQGDTIYLRWDFPGGTQEESLLFGGEGQRVEGTFVNSAGAWGSITGKKAGPCKTTADR
jgi:hypothetical protein